MSHDKPNDEKTNEEKKMFDFYWVFLIKTQSLKKTILLTKSDRDGFVKAPILMFILQIFILFYLSTRILDIYYTIIVLQFTKVGK